MRMPTVAAGQMAPRFELKRTDGEPYSLQSALAKGPVLAAFFKVSCSTCRYTFPFLERIYQHFRDKGVQIWGISQDNPYDTERFAKEFGIAFPLLIDEDHYAISREYGLSYVPTLFLIAPAGNVEVSCDGFSKADLTKIHRFLASHFGVTPAELFRRSEKIPEYKPG
jgi:peroxiredoxin